MQIERVTIRRLSIPLTKPYHLSLETVRTFDTVFVELVDATGEKSFGEATILNGYFEVATDTIWTESIDFADALIGREVESVTRMLSVSERSLLTRSAFAAALDWLEESTICSFNVPVVGIVSARDGVSKCVEMVRKQCENGHETIKLKIGFDPSTDADCLRAATRAVSDDVEFRVDANQGYSLSEARNFLDWTDTRQLDLLEQPLPVGNLQDIATLREETDVSLMLDEELTDEDDLRAIVDAGAADMVKTKMMKQGGPAEVQQLVRTAQKWGLGVVFGNGVQSDVGCLQEGQLWKELGLDTVAECNGWHKQEISLLDPAPIFESGSLIWPGGPPDPDTAILDCYTKQEYITKM